jgi:hypothetical protein
MFPKHFVLVVGSFIILQTTNTVQSDIFLQLITVNCTDGSFQDFQIDENYEVIIKANSDYNNTSL